MEFPLGVALANFYMCAFESNVFNEDPELKPEFFCRNVDNYFLVTNSEEQLTVLVDATSNNFCLTFSIEKKHQPVHQFFFMYKALQEEATTSRLSTNSLRMQGFI